MNKVDSSISISDERTFHSIIFIAGLISPSPDDTWKLISKKASKEMVETVGESEAKKFIKSIGKYAVAQGKNGAYRLLGNKNENGEIFWEVFEKTH